MPGKTVGHSLALMAYLTWPTDIWGHLQISTGIFKDLRGSSDICHISENPKVSVTYKQNIY